MEDPATMLELVSGLLVQDKFELDLQPPIRRWKSKSDRTII